MSEWTPNPKSGYDWFVEQFKVATGIDLAYYKRPQMERRLLALCNKRGFSSFEEYFPAVCQDDLLMNELLDRMTINVSEFFRNPNRWQTLKNDILPSLLTGKTFHAWSAACSTGQEPFTLLMILAELLPIEQISILATDIDLHALEFAQNATYTETDVASIEKNLRNKYFIPSDNGKVMIHPFYRKHVFFEQHNLLSDPYPKQLDLIICRNVLIYFTDDAKNLLIEKFSRALRPGGILFVGGTEQIFHPESFRLKQISPFFYQRI
ncbi:CheR family methyltransferase [Sulfoacidibacillus thermotolerans]|uniref:protein-glutamate O-methyltransferase n=1 Tax=Sulfoacidibacillus thermotolerans TaxID=1765684 RepID=A0A2U3DCR8_SULT2|nr:protein-glutamate O-methyltransferase CheR [Sulfoacidibacillus thermotolerans]PWI59077.1 chemotaxis protein CheR [Sulfoacidibacillus thermotolerans]